MEVHSGRHPFGNSRHGRSAATVTPAPAFVVPDPRARQTPLMPVPHLSFPRKRESRTAALWTPAFAGVTRRGRRGNGEACRTESIAAGTAQRLRSFQTETLPVSRACTVPAAPRKRGGPGSRPSEDSLPRSSVCQARNRGNSRGPPTLPPPELLTVRRGDARRGFQRVEWRRIHREGDGGWVDGSKARLRW